MQELEKFANFIAKGDVESVKSLTEELLAKGITPSRIVEEGIVPGMDVVGQKYERGEYFLPELLMAAEAAKVVTGIIKPYLKKEGIKGLGTIVIGTVFGDVHNVGKDLVASTLEGVGFKLWERQKTLKAHDGTQKEIDISFLLGILLLTLGHKALWGAALAQISSNTCP